MVWSRASALAKSLEIILNHFQPGFPPILASHLALHPPPFFLLCISYPNKHHHQQSMGLILLCQIPLLCPEYLGLWTLCGKHILQWRYRNEVSVLSFIHVQMLLNFQKKLQIIAELFIKKCWPPSTYPCQAHLTFDCPSHSLHPLRLCNHTGDSPYITLCPQ